MKHVIDINVDLPVAVLNVIPNPVLVKDAELRYVWVNRGFEELFGITLAELRGRRDIDAFPDRQSSQCNGGDMRVLKEGAIDEARETVFHASGTEHEILTRKSRLTLPSGEVFLVGVLHDLTDMVAAQNTLVAQALELERLARTDPMTGCLNRRALFETATSSPKTDVQAGVLLIDVDHFKSINDKYGHAVGDGALVYLVQTISDCLNDAQLLARIGGEEFVVWLEDTSDGELEALALSIKSALAAAPFVTGGQQLDVTASIGGAITKLGQRSDIDDLLRSADEALYAIKHDGRNGYRLAPGPSVVRRRGV